KKRKVGSQKQRLKHLGQKNKIRNARRKMKADLPINHVEDISVAVVMDNEPGETIDWQVYLINEKSVQIQNVMVTSKGYGEKDGVEVKTSVLRHFIGDVDSMDYARIEPIDSQVFGLNNEYWLSYY